MRQSSGRTGDDRRDRASRGVDFDCAVGKKSALPPSSTVSTARRPTIVADVSEDVAVTELLKRELDPVAFGQRVSKNRPNIARSSTDCELRRPRTSGYATRSAGKPQTTVVL